MIAAEHLAEVRLYQRFRDSEDRAAFEALYHRYDAPPWEDEAERDGDNLVDFVVRKYRIRRYDAEDIVADLWADLIFNQPEIDECVRAFLYKKLAWLAADYMRKKKKRPDAPWRAKPNKYLDPGATVDGVVAKTDRRAAVREPRYRAQRIAHFLDLAVLQAALSRLPPDEEEAIRLHWLDQPKRSLEEAARAADMRLSPFRALEKRALNHLRLTFSEVQHEIGEPANRHALLDQWGEVRGDWHWVPDDENVDCDCSECKAVWRKRTSLCGRSAPLRLTASPPPPLRILVTDEDGYKLRRHGRPQTVAEYLQIVEQGNPPSHAMLRTVIPGPTITRWVAA